MKKLLVTLAVLMLLPVTFSYAQSHVGFAGVRHDDGTLFSIGVGSKLTDNIMILNYSDVGYYGSLAAEVAIFKKFGKFYGGLIAGPDIDWTTGDTPNMTSYLVGASGGILCYELSDKYGLGVFGKYKFTFEGDNLYQNGTVFGGGVNVWF